MIDLFCLTYHSSNFLLTIIKLVSVSFSCEESTNHLTWTCLFCLKATLAFARHLFAIETIANIGVIKCIEEGSHTEVSSHFQGFISMEKGKVRNTEQGKISTQTQSNWSSLSPWLWNIAMVFDEDTSIYTQQANRHDLLTKDSGYQLLKSKSSSSCSIVPVSQLPRWCVGVFRSRFEDSLGTNVRGVNWAAVPVGSNQQTNHREPGWRQRHWWKSGENQRQQ